MSDGEDRRERQPRPERLTIRDIARLADVSVATAYRVAKGKPDVAAETRARVTSVMQEYAFIPQRDEDDPASGWTGLVGFSLPYVDESYFAAILSGAAEALYQLNQRVVLCPTYHQYYREVTLLDRLLGGTTDGALILLPEQSNAELSRLKELGYPFVVIDPRKPLSDGIPSVSATNAAGARTATDHLLGLGHRRIGMITGTPNWVATDQRIEGYRMALAAVGVPFRADLLAGGDFATGTGYTAAQHLLDLPDPPTAIFASNDNLAIGAMRAAFERGLHVPDELSIMGFDDVVSASDVFPPLTTVRQPLAELGRTAVAMLNRLIDGHEAESMRLELATQLVIRASTAPALVRMGA